MADDLSWMDGVPNAGGAPPAQTVPQQPAFPVVAPHRPPGSSDPTELTNLSDADYLKFKSGVAPTSAPATATDDSWMKAIPDVAPKQSAPQGGGLVANAGAGTSDTTAAFLGAPVDLTTGALNLGARGINAVAGTNISPIEKPVGGSDFFRSAFGYMGADPRTVAATTGSERVARGAGAGVASMLLPWAGARALPALTGIPGAIQQAVGSGSASQMARIGAEAGGGGELAANAVPEPWKPAARMAGSLGAASVEPAISLLKPAAATAIGRIPPISTMKPVVSTNAQETSVGKTLTGLVGNTPIEESPVGPLNLAQATNNPEIAARADLAPSYNATANAALLKAQQEAIQKQIAKVGTSAAAPDASAAFTTALRQGRQVAGSEESRLWTVPALAEAKITATPVQQAVNTAVAGMDPVLQNGMTPQLKALVNRLNGLTATTPNPSTFSNTAPNGLLYDLGPAVAKSKIPPATTVQDLNGIRSGLERIARTSIDGAERSMARELSGAFMHGMDQVPEIAGRPAVTRPMYEQVPPGTPNPMVEISPAVASDPAITQAYQTARDYTRQMRTMFGTPDAAALLNKNAAGVFTKDASEGARQFFNFSNGSPEGPQSIAQLSDFVGQLKSQPMAPQVAGQMRDAARSYVASALTKAARAEDGQNFNPKTMQDFLRTNGSWIKSSGLFEQSQIDAADALLDYTGMLRRPEQLLRQVNSATQPRAARQATFVDQIMNPTARHIIEAGGALTGAHQHGVIGGAVGMMIGGGFEKMVVGAEDAMRELMAQALLDPSVAKGLMMKASAGNRLLMSPTARQAIDTARAAAASGLAAEQMSSRTQPVNQQSAVQ